jgi:SAM-dependent methyltransferase
MPFDPDHFAKHVAKHGPVDALTAFRYAHEHNLWHGPETRSGPGSSLNQTAVIAQALPQLCQRYEIRTLLDVPCGTFHWMACVDLGNTQYIGGDLLPEVVAEAKRQYGTDHRLFIELDLTRSPLPDADLLLCRDCFVHLSYADIARAIDNIRRSTLTYMLTTTFPAETQYHDIVTGDWRPVNLEASPFSFPPPLEMVREECTEQDGAFADKSLGLWRVRDLPPLPGYSPSHLDNRRS